MHKLSADRIGYPVAYQQFYIKLRYCSGLKKTKRMKSLDFASMENIQGGDLGGAIGINLPLTTLLSALGLGSLATAVLGLGVGISFNLTGISLPSLPLGL